MADFTGSVLTTQTWNAGEEGSITASVTWGSTLVSGDTFTFTNVLPENTIEIKDFEVWGSELDTNASPTATLIFGNSGTSNGYLTSKTAGGANVQLFYKGDGSFLGTNISNRTIIGTLGGTLGTGSGSGTLYIRVSYRATNHS